MQVDKCKNACSQCLVLSLCLREHHVESTWGFPLKQANNRCKCQSTNRNLIKGHNLWGLPQRLQETSVTSALDLLKWIQYECSLSKNNIFYYGRVSSCWELLIWKAAEASVGGWQGWGWQQTVLWNCSFTRSLHLLLYRCSQTQSCLISADKCEGRPHLFVSGLTFIYSVYR